MNTIEPIVNTPMITEWKYALDISTTEEFIRALLNGTITNYETKSTTTDSLFLQNSSDYVTKITYYPVKLDVFNANVPTVSIDIGNAIWNSFPSGSTPLYISKSVTSIKWFEHTETRVYNNFLDFEPYTVFTLYVPFFDAIKLPTKYFYDGICGYIAIDFVSGVASLYITNSTGKVVYTVKQAQMGIDISIGATNAEEQKRNRVLMGLSIGASLVTMGIGAVSGNPLALVGAVGLGAKAVSQTLQNNVDTYSGHAGTGGRDGLATERDIILFKEYPSGVTFPDKTLRGKPCKQNLSLSTLTGYTQIGEIHIENINTATSEELELIENNLKSGVIL